MDFAYTADEQAFAAEVRRFLAEHPPERFAVDGTDAGYGSGSHSHAFLHALAEQGWLSMTWPKAHGGQERPMFFKLVLLEELALAGAPFGPLAGCWQTADAIIEYGSERLRGEVLPAIARGEATFWQGYSEPGAGSDLLGLKTEARRDGDDYVIRGHKIWSSHEGFVALLNGLDSDRLWGRFYKAPAMERVLHQLVEYANTTIVRGAPLARDPFVRRRLAGAAVDVAALRTLFYRVACLLRDGAPITYETALAKVLADETGQKIAKLGMDLLGLWGPLRAGSPWAKLDGHIAHLYQTSLGHTIAGGTNEVLRTTVAVRGLGLPAEAKIR